MRTSAILSLGLAGLATAAPASVVKRQSSGGISDADIFNYALTLEHLEATFYKTGLQNYSASAFSKAGYPAWVRERVSEIGTHEASHVAFLTGALTAAGATPVKACNYDFGVNSVDSFLATAQVLEGVGVAAYLGAAKNISSPAYLTYAGSVLVVEARHNAWIRSAVEDGDAFPQAYETPLEFDQVYSLAAGFITSCPSSNPALPVKAFPGLTVKPVVPKSTYYAGQAINVTPATEINGTAYVNFLQVTGALSVAYEAGKSVKIPAGLAGQTYVTISSVNGSITDDATLAGPAIIEIPLPNKEFPIASAV